MSRPNATAPSSNHEALTTHDVIPAKAGIHPEMAPQPQGRSVRHLQQTHTFREFSMRRILTIVLILAFAVVLFFGGRWYSYVTNTTSPYDEVGIDLNLYMPAPLREWGCDQLQANFPGAVPPYGCATGDGTDWI